MMSDEEERTFLVDKVTEYNTTFNRNYLATKTAGSSSKDGNNLGESRRTKRCSVTFTDPSEVVNQECKDPLFQNLTIGSIKKFKSDVDDIDGTDSKINMKSGDNSGLLGQLQEMEADDPNGSLASELGGSHFKFKDNKCKKKYTKEMWPGKETSLSLEENSSVHSPIDTVDHAAPMDTL